MATDSLFFEEEISAPAVPDSVRDRADLLRAMHWERKAMVLAESVVDLREELYTLRPLIIAVAALVYEDVPHYVRGGRIVLDADRFAALKTALDRYYRGL